MITKLAKVLIEGGLITQKQLDKALERQSYYGGSLAMNLTQLGFITENEITQHLNKQPDFDAIELSEFEFDPGTVRLIPAEVAMKFLVIPLKRVDKTLTIAMADPTNTFVLDAIKFITGCQIKPLVSSESSIRKAIDQNYDTGRSHSEVMKDLEKLKVIEEEKEELSEIDLETALEEAPLVRLVNNLIMEAIRKGASDIHIEPYERIVRVRYRIDGTLIEMPPLPFRYKPAIISRIKIMADLDISERRLPQDGRIKIRLSDKTVDLRVSTVPTIFGEKAAIRILDPTSQMLDVTELGFQKDALYHFLEAIKRAYGMVLVTGPTGSGKTTTLYSALSLLNTIDTNIMTAEDPIEYNIPGINQAQVRSEIGLSFATLLRVFLRQDPNIVMVGEIRDKETADIAIRTALTGHLVLSTLHTNDAPSTINRLIDMGVPPFLVSSSINLIVAQRLLRKLCKRCKARIDATPEMINELALTPEEAEEITFFKPTGCPKCNQTGYKGRVGAFEVMPISPNIRRMISKGASTEELQGQAVKEGMLTLRADALLKLKDGITTFEEVIRETTTD